MAQVLEAIVDGRGVRPGRRGRWRSGPGLGILTGALLGRGAQVTAVEVDPRLVGASAERFDGRAAASGSSRATCST